jgi:hypothetical protein
MSSPNFFLVGAPKCGTTTLYELFRQHPDIFMPHSDSKESYWLHKEPFYFCPDLEMKDYVSIKDRDQYFGLFQDAGDAKRVGDASAWYLYSKEAPKLIHDFNLDSRIIITIRNPVDWMRSWHHNCLTDADEDIADFGKALRAESDRAAGKRIPRMGSYPRCLRYRHASRFSEQIQRYFDQFGRDNVKVIFMEDIPTRPKETLSNLFAFLGVDSALEFPVPIENPSRVLPATHRIEARIQRSLMGRPGLHRAVDGISRRIPGFVGKSYRALTDKLPPFSDKKIDPQLRKELLSEYQDEITRLGTLIDRDLGHWMKN